MQLETSVIFAKKELQYVLDTDVACDTHSCAKSPPLHVGFQYLSEIGSVSTEGRL